MASKRVSPAANLLRHSKLFSLPPPLRFPQAENKTSRYNASSHTATLPYPTRAAIETPPRALKFNEWGFKRPLPPRARKSSTPVIRVSAVDNSDHITDYESAADHVLSLEKWQEMDIPMTMPQANSERWTGTLQDRGPQSAFEDQLPGKSNLAEASGPSRRKWKYDGPWILGMTPLEFEEYLDKQIRHRRSEFLDFLRTYLTKKRSGAAQSGALRRGEAVKQPERPLSTDEFREGVKQLKLDRIELWNLIWRFLDIPGQVPAKEPSTTSFSEAVDRYFSDAEEAPPRTHPSVGLSYTRTGNYMYNHPVLGPQRHRPPVHGRILQHANVANPARNSGSLIGVGGFVGNQATESFSFADRTRPGEFRFDAELEGGSKAWVAPKRASVDTSGRVQLTVDKASADTVAVWEQQVPPGTAFDPSDPFASPANSERGFPERRGARPLSFGRLFPSKSNNEPST